MWIVLVKQNMNQELNNNQEVLSNIKMIFSEWDTLRRLGTNLTVQTLILLSSSTFVGCIWHNRTGND